MTGSVQQALLWVIYQLETFSSTKDYILLALVSLVGALIGAAWMDSRARISALEKKLDEKVNTDVAGYQRLASVEAQLAAVWRAVDAQRHADRDEDKAQ